MTLWVLDLAEADLLRGFRFYERKSRGVGWYFLDTLSAEIESLHLYAGVHRKYLGYFRMLSRRFPYAVYYRMWPVMRFKFGEFWIAGATRSGFEKSSGTSNRVAGRIALPAPTPPDMRVRIRRFRSD